MAAVWPILSQILGAVLPQLLSWFFSGTVNETFKIVPGLEKMDQAKPDEPLVLPDLKMPGEDQ